MSSDRPDGPGDDPAGREERRMVGKFEVLEQIGRGAMGAVFKARQVSMDRVVALKVLPPSLARNEDYTARFLREAKAVAHLNHPNIVQAIDAGKAGVYYYFVMEYVDGPSAARLVATQGPLPERRALEVIRDAARGLVHAHEHDIVHRDVKPDNILIAPDGTAKLADLGLARETENIESRVTQTGIAVGTPEYISPEQAKGFGELDGRTDVYSLGGTFYHLLTGWPPYESESAVDVMYKHIHEPPPDPREIRPGISAGTAAIIRKAMAKDRGDRYPSADEMLADLEKLLRMKKSTAQAAAVGDRATGSIVSRRTVETPIPGDRRARRSQRKKRTGLIVGGAVVAAVLVAALIAGVLVISAGRDEPEVAEQERGEEPADRTGQELLDYVAAEIAKHPDEFQAGLARWDRAIEALAEDPVSRMKAEDARATLEERYREAAGAALAARTESAEALARQGDYDAALAAYDGLRPQFAELLAGRVEVQRAELRSQAEKQIRATLAEAQRLAGDGRPDHGLQKLEAMQSMRYAALDPERAQVRAELVRSAAEVRADAQKQALADARNAIDALLDRMEAAAGKADLAGAAKLARRAENDERYAAASDRLAAVLAMADALDRAAAVRDTPLADAFRPHLGKPLTVRTRVGREIEGELKAVNADALVLEKTYYVMKEERHRDYTVKYADLSAETVARFKPGWEPETAVDHAAAALIAAGKRDESALTAALARVKDHPLRGRYEAALEALKLSPEELARRRAEAAAKTAWETTVLPLLDKDDRVAAETGRLKALLKAYRREHGETAFAAAREPQIARVLGELGDVSDEAEHVWRKLTEYARAHPRLTEPTAQALWKALDTFTEKYGTTAFADSVALKVAALRERVRPHLPPIRFDSDRKLGVSLVSQDPATGVIETKGLGTTPSEDGKGIEIPAGAVWYVQVPRGRLLNFGDADLERLAAELKRKSVPGLNIAGDGPSKQQPKVTDAGLRHLADLPELRALWLDDTPGITAAGIAHLSRLRDLKFLSLHECRKTGDEGLKHVGKLTNLTWLNLATTGITNDGLQYLGDLKHLKFLRLGCNKIGDAGLAHLKPLTELRILKFGYAGVTDQGLAQLAALRKLRYLRLRATRVSGTGLVHLKHLRHLEAINLSSPSTAMSQTTDAGLAAIGQVRSLRTLSLSNQVRITDAGLGHLKGLPNLEKLTFYRCPKITDGGIAHLKGHDRLETLSLKGCSKVTGACLRHLRALPSLTKVDLAGTQVSEPALKRLRERLEQRREAAEKEEARREKDAEGAWGQITDYARRRGVTKATAKRMSAALDKFEEKYGATAFAASVAGKMAALRERIGPHLPKTKIELSRPVYGAIASGMEPREGGPVVERRLGGGVGTIEAPARAMWHVKSRNATPTDQDLRALVSDLQNVSGAGLSFRVALIAHGKITDEGLAHVRSLKDLRFLDLHMQHQITDAGLRALSGQTELGYLDLSWCKRLTDDGFKHLAGLTELRWLNLDHSPVGDDGLAHLKDLRKLEVLNLKICQRVTGKSLPWIGRQRNLKALNLGYLKGLTDDDLAHLAGLRHLEWLSVGWCPEISDDGLKYLTGLRSLKELHVRKTKVTDAGRRALWRAIPGLKIDGEEAPPGLKAPKPDPDDGPPEASDRVAE